jgi:hypothetical protein
MSVLEKDTEWDQKEREGTGEKEWNILYGGTDPKNTRMKCSPRLCVIARDPRVIT